jgi:hypothetical protein
LAREAALANYERAFRMQTAVPDLADLSGESKTTKQMYGLDDPFKAAPTFHPAINLRLR